AMGARPAQPVGVAAASDLKFALDELAGGFRRETGVAVQVTFGSSGQFAQQIRHGLPVDVYLSADENYVFQLADAGLTQGRGVVYAHGRVAVIVPKSSPVVFEPGLASLRTALPGMRAFAIANPAHAPYGRAAQQALERLGLWPAVHGKLVLGENVAQATQYVTSGAAQAGITALSLALAPEVASLTRSLVLPADLHAPMRQRMVLLRRAGRDAAAFYQFLQGPAARATLQRYGFGPA
ncbi:MAG TPA: molybdate ABC transporter substrate-binding protein, partial [Ramlibacter sp.]